MLKAKIVSIITMNTLTSTKKKILTNLVFKKKKTITLFLFLSLLVNYCILMYLETIIFLYL